MHLVCMLSIQLDYSFKLVISSNHYSETVERMCCYLNVHGFHASLYHPSFTDCDEPPLQHACRGNNKGIVSSKLETKGGSFVLEFEGDMWTNK